MTPKVRDGVVGLVTLAVVLFWLLAGPYVLGVARNIPLAAGVSLGGGLVLLLAGGVLIQHLQSRDPK